MEAELLQQQQKQAVTLELLAFTMHRLWALFKLDAQK